MTRSRSRALERALSPFKDFGALGGALYVVDRLLQRVSPRLGLYAYDLMVQPITGKALLPARFAESVEFREIRRGDPDIARMPARTEIKESRFEQGAICLGAYRKGALLGYLWLCFGEYAEDEVRCTYVLPGGGTSVFDFDLFVMPESRMGIGFMAVWQGADRYLWDRGVRATFSRVSRFNTASHRAHARLGGRRIGAAVFLRLWRAELMAATVPPYVSVYAGGARRPRLRLRD